MPMMRMPMFHGWYWEISIHGQVLGHIRCYCDMGTMKHHREHQLRQLLLALVQVLGWHVFGSGCTKCRLITFLGLKTWNWKDTAYITIPTRHMMGGLATWVTTVWSVLKSEWQEQKLESADYKAQSMQPWLAQLGQRHYVCDYVCNAFVYVAVTMHDSNLLIFGQCGLLLPAFTSPWWWPQRHAASRPNVNLSWRFWRSCSRRKRPMGCLSKLLRSVIPGGSPVPCERHSSNSHSPCSKGDQSECIIPRRVTAEGMPCHACNSICNSVK